MTGRESDWENMEPVVGQGGKGEGEGQGGCHDAEEGV